MLRNYSKWKSVILLPVLIYGSFTVAQIVVGLAYILFEQTNISINLTVANTVAAAFVYALTLGLILFIPWFLAGKKTNLTELGYGRPMAWSDIIVAPFGMIIYFIMSAILLGLVSYLFPFFDINQAQDTGFDNLNNYGELLMAFFTLVVVAPVAEETIFRGYLFGKLKKIVPLWLAILITSALFGAIHGAWNLAFDTFALSIMLCLLRERTGSIWASILLHMMKNGLAFYLLFINPTIFNTLGN